MFSLDFGRLVNAKNEAQTIYSEGDIQIDEHVKSICSLATVQ